MTYSDKGNALFFHMCVKMAFDIHGDSRRAFVQYSILWLVVDQSAHCHSLLLTSTQDIIPISFGDTGSSVVSHYQQDKINLIVSESGQVQGEQFRIMPEILPDDGTFHEETIDSCLSLFPYWGSLGPPPKEFSPKQGRFLA